jgi:LysM repeat protein
MTFPVSRFGSGLLLLLGLVLSGCLPSAQSQLDEEREPHFLRGKSRASEMDYKGAIESFEKALEINPQSASAHFELGCLFEQKEVADPAAAIYHYDHYLKLRPNAGNGEIARQRIAACKQELARTVSLVPVTEKVQRELEQLTEENKRLTEQNKRLQEELEKWRAYASRLPASASAPVVTSAATPTPTRPSPPSGQPAAVEPVPANPGGTSRPTAAAPSLSRTHTVRPGETPMMIARKYGLKVEALLAANPGVDARRLRVGQTLNVPAP